MSSRDQAHRPSLRWRSACSWWCRWSSTLPAGCDLYYTLTLIALLSIASAGVWITFYIGRINIGQAAYALIGGYVSAILVATYGWSFWLTIPVGGLPLRRGQQCSSACRSCACAASISPW